jgi:hypothetical protein
MKFRVVSAGHYLHAVREAEPLPELGPVLKQVCRERPRRVDRFIELALLGSGLCARSHALKPDCGIYIGSGFGPMGSNVAVQEQLFRDRAPPKPFDFMNILGASAGFHVAKNLGLTGQNLFVSRRRASLEAVLVLAEADLKLGAVSQALVGVVEEVTLPLAQHRQRQGLVADTPVAEGSHWLLLEAAGESGRCLSVLRFEEQEGLDAYLQAHPSDGKETSASAIHDNPQAARLTGFLAEDAAGDLLLVGRGAGHSLLHLSP